MIVLLVSVPYAGCGEEAPASGDRGRDGSFEHPEGATSRESGLESSAETGVDAAADAGSLETGTDSAGWSDARSDAAGSNDAVSESEVGPGFDGGSPADAGAEAPDAVRQEDAGPSTACSVYCACMGATCAGYLYYRYPDEASCLLACSSFSLPESICFRGFCIAAEGEPDPVNREHFCQHAWGMYDLMEC